MLLRLILDFSTCFAPVCQDCRYRKTCLANSLLTKTLRVFIWLLHLLLVFRSYFSIRPKAGEDFDRGNTQTRSLGPTAFPHRKGSDLLEINSCLCTNNQLADKPLSHAFSLSAVYERVLRAHADTKLKRRIVF